MLFCPRIWQRWRDLGEAGGCWRIRGLPREEASLKEGFVRPLWSPVPGARPSALTRPPALVPSSSSCLGAAPQPPQQQWWKAFCHRSLALHLCLYPFQDPPLLTLAWFLVGARGVLISRMYRSAFSKGQEHLHTGSLLTLLAAALHASWALPADGLPLR